MNKLRAHYLGIRFLGINYIIGCFFPVYWSCYQVGDETFTYLTLRPTFNTYFKGTIKERASLRKLGDNEHV